MHKIQQVKYTILSAIAISAILIASTAVAGMQSSQQAFAQNTTGATTQNQTNTTGATTQNQTSGASQELQKLQHQERNHQVIKILCGKYSKFFAKQIARA